MGNGIGLAWWHHCKLYAKQFKEPVPHWLYEIEIGKRVKLIKLVTQLAWRLPAEVLPDDAPEDKPASKRK